MAVERYDDDRGTAKHEWAKRAKGALHAKIPTARTTAGGALNGDVHARG